MTLDDWDVHSELKLYRTRVETRNRLWPRLIVFFCSDF